MRLHHPHLASRKTCCGCAACHDACVEGAIGMVRDADGFAFPSVDQARCIGCGRCQSVCPALNPAPARRPMAVYAARLSDDERLMQSSSGGIFTALAEPIVNAGGLVIGAVWDSDGSVVHRTAESPEELASMRGSKYLQSRTEGIFSLVRDRVAAGRRVLFTGTPCQILALRRFLGEVSESVLMVEVICHGTPSAQLWKRYLEQFPGDLTEASFRDKELGWPRSLTRLCYRDGSERKIERNLYTYAFALDLCNRLSCSQCPARNLSSGADITLGDFGGVEDYHPELNDGKGVSCVLVNTDFGSAAFESIRSRCRVFDASYEQVTRRNPNLIRSFAPHPRRGMFLRGIRANRAWDGWTMACLDAGWLRALLFKIRLLFS